MKTRTTVGIVLTALAIGAAVVIVQDIRSSDEGPIRVRNGGSMDAIAANGRVWQNEPSGDNEDSSPSYSHEPTGFDFDPFDKDLFVKVTHTGGTCSGNDNTNSGRIVRVEYTATSGATFAGIFRRARSGAINVRTKVRPPTGFQLVDPQTLRHAPPGHISAVRIDNWNCTFPNAAALQQIEICMSANRPECK